MEHALVCDPVVDFERCLTTGDAFFDELVDGFRCDSLPFFRAAGAGRVVVRHHKCPIAGKARYVLCVGQDAGKYLGQGVADGTEARRVLFALAGSFGRDRIANPGLRHKDAVRCQHRGNVLVELFRVEHDPRSRLDRIANVHDHAIEFVLCVEDPRIGIPNDQLKSGVLHDLPSAPFPQIFEGDLDDFFCSDRHNVNMTCHISIQTQQRTREHTVNIFTLETRRGTNICRAVGICGFGRLPSTATARFSIHPPNPRTIREGSVSTTSPPLLPAFERACVLACVRTVQIHHDAFFDGRIPQHLPRRGQFPTATDQDRLWTLPVVAVVRKIQECRVDQRFVVYEFVELCALCLSVRDECLSKDRFDDVDLLKLGTTRVENFLE
mmetsp:Transcript_7314/g.21227  ORF Transcript_7314/g.21227 Transcript_7314/m.21227 type:complete len:381 (-) Transcript_7314:451-1593(-)